jgi:hypothetical protein
VLIPAAQAQRYGGHNHRGQGKFIGYIAQILTA